MEGIYNVLGSKKFTRKKMSLTQAWVLESALKEELEASWTDTFETVDERDVGDNANVIPSHVVYKVKNETTLKWWRIGYDQTEIEME